MISPIPQVMSMAPYALADLQPHLLSLSQNESAYTCSPKALEAGQKALSTARLYSDPDWLELRQAIADVHGLNTANILCCLLYTSPSPRDKRQSRMPSSA